MTIYTKLARRPSKMAATILLPVSAFGWIIETPCWENLSFLFYAIGGWWVQAYSNLKRRATIKSGFVMWMGLFEWWRFGLFGFWKPCATSWEARHQPGAWMQESRDGTPEAARKVQLANNPSRFQIKKFEAPQSSQRTQRQKSRKRRCSDNLVTGWR